MLPTVVLRTLIRERFAGNPEVHRVGMSQEGVTERKLAEEASRQSELHFLGSFRGCSSRHSHQRCWQARNAGNPRYSFPSAGRHFAFDRGLRMHGMEDLDLQDYLKALDRKMPVVSSASQSDRAKLACRPRRFFQEVRLYIGSSRSHTLRSAARPNG